MHEYIFRIVGARHAFLVAVFGSFISSGALAQSEQPPIIKGYSRTSDVLLNAAVGGLTTGLTAAIHRRPVGPALLRGLVFGGAEYSGKQIVALNSQSSVFIGRAISAVGASAIRNVASGRGAFTQLVIPYGPIRFYLNTDSLRKSRAKLDLATALVIATDVWDSDKTMDLRQSLYSGAAIFRVDNEQFAGGSHLAGVIRFTRGQELGETIRRTIGHEMVHVAQFDESFIQWAEPAEKATLQLIPGGRAVHSFVDLGLNVPVWSLFNLLIPYGKRPWEREAKGLERDL